MQNVMMHHGSIRKALSAEILAAKDRALGAMFLTGYDDCALWVAEIYRRVLKCDPAKEYRGKYRSREEAAEILGPGGVAAAAIRSARHLRWRRIDPVDADAGDGALIRIAGGELSIAIFDGQFWVGRIDYGYSGHPHSAVVRAWCVV